jgi:predicted anti-sigma-YlaC factor YlaD
MNESNCESVRIAAMALADGEQPTLDPAFIAVHLAGCAACRLELEQIRAVTGLLDGKSRREHRVVLWPALEPRIAAPSRQRRVFVVLGILLVAYKIAEFAPSREFGMAVQLVPVAIALAAFRYLKENPFRITTGLKLEGD